MNIPCPMCQMKMVNTPGTKLYNCPGCKAQLTLENVREFPSPFDQVKEATGEQLTIIDPDAI